MPPWLLLEPPHESGCFFMRAWVLTQELRCSSDQVSKSIPEPMLWLSWAVRVDLEFQSLSLCMKNLRRWVTSAMSRWLSCSALKLCDYSPRISSLFSFFIFLNLSRRRPPAHTSYHLPHHRGRSWLLRVFGKHSRASGSRVSRGELMIHDYHCRNPK